MNLLIITQRVDKNDANLGLFLEWLNKFSKFYENVFVISQKTGEYDLPKNVKVFSLGKEKGFSKFRQFLNFYKLLFMNLPKSGAIFVHMIPMWAVLTYPLSLIYRKKIYLWYTHKQVNFWLRFSEKIVSKIFTASKESCRVNSKKVVVVGHGINIQKFKSQISNLKNENQSLKLVIFSAGRISKTKNQKILIEAADILVNKKNIKNLEIQIAGEPIMKDDFKYLEDLKNFVKEKKVENYVKFIGGVSYGEIDKYYKEAYLFINLSNTGSVDRAVLEAMSCDLNIITSNEAFFSILPEENILRKLNSEALAEKINLFLRKEKTNHPEFREYVAKNHNLEENIKKMAKFMKN